MKVVSVKGEVVDMDLLLAQNPNRAALGNAKMNARGDIIDSNGVVVKSRTQINKEYNNSNPKAVKQVSLKDLSDEVFVTPEQAIAEMQKAAAQKFVENTAVVTPTPPRKRKTEDRED